MMSRILLVMLALSFLFGALLGRLDAVTQASISGAKEAVTLLLGIGGTICLWCGLMEVMDRSGLTARIARLLTPVIRLLYGRDGDDPEAREALAQNMAANLLGLGSAATPAGLRAAARLHRLAEQRGERPKNVWLLIAVNTASLQLLPTTVAAVRAELGSPAPFDILPAVWLSSLGSVCAAALCAKALGRRA